MNKEDWKVYTPIICEETGFYGGNFSYYGLSLKEAWRALEWAIKDGRVKRKTYEEVRMQESLEKEIEDRQRDLESIKTMQKEEEKVLKDLRKIISREEEKMRKMRNQEPLEQEKEKENNVVELSLIGGNGEGEDWLSKLPIGSTFLTRDTQQVSQHRTEKAPTLTYWYLDQKTEKSVKLLFDIPDGNRMEKWFIPLEFCKLFEKWEILSTGPTIKEVEVSDKET